MLVAADSKSMFFVTAYTSGLSGFGVFVGLCAAEEVLRLRESI